MAIPIDGIIVFALVLVLLVKVVTSNFNQPFIKSLDDVLDTVTVPLLVVFLLTAVLRLAEVAA